MNQAMQRIGVLGGTFDPVHYGHLAIAEEVRYALDLTSVYMVPVVRQPLKPERSRAGPQQRLEMVRLACASNAAFVPSDIDLQREPPSFTVDTLAALRRVVGSDAQVWFILGGDSLTTFPQWYAPQQIIALAQLAIVQRPGYHINMTTLEAHVPGLAARSTLIPGPMLDISSSNLRQRIASGQTVRYQMPDAVINYIQTQNLYTSDQSYQQYEI
jgi:nicotinate-nucleotide adenylyltransferase